MSPILCRRLLLAALVAGCALLPPDDNAQWEATPSHKALPAHHLRVSWGELQDVCKGAVPQGWIAFGCAKRIPSANVCVFYTEIDPPEWVVAHEKKHCEGYDHAPLDGRK